jgi:hexosaminidase
MKYINLISFNIFFFFLPVLLIGNAACTSSETPDISKIGLIPLPVEIIKGDGAFKLNSASKIVVLNGDDELRRIAHFLQESINLITANRLSVSTSDSDFANGDIIIQLINDQNLGQEGYNLMVDRKNVFISANKPEGVFRGIQTLRQLLPISIDKATSKQTEWMIPACNIRDYPRFQYRGSMLDVSRHFFGVDVVKQYIDYLAAYKMNVLHMHLSDDQGWRIEIKSWPNLTAHGSKTQVGGGKGGYFTQEEFMELIQYAKERYITIIPEIDMPGHTNAALASYPELNETVMAPELYTGTEVGFSTLATRKEITYQFVDDVVRELSELISGDYIHIGGDESHVTKKEDYLYFMNRVQAIVKSHGKKSIGWDEIATSTLLPGTIAQYWSSVENAELAVGQGAKILLSPSSKVYLDMKYDSTTILGLTWAGIIEVDKAYNWELSDLIPDIDDENIVGIEAPLWTETAEKLADIQFLVFPRLLGVAEIGWSPASIRNWETYKIRLAKQKGWFEKMNINYYKSPLVPWESN